MQTKRGMIKAVGLCLAITFAITMSNSRGIAQSDLPLEVVLSNGQSHLLSLSELDDMEQIEFETGSIWTDGTHLYSGVSLYNLLQHFDAKGTKLQLTALNDYSIEIPIADLEKNAPIVATRVDGEIMKVRDKGPYWVIYPFDASPRYRTELIHARSIWQLQRFEVLQ